KNKMAVERAYVGARKEIGFAPESTRGTKVSATTFVPYEEEGFDYGPQVEKARDTQSKGRIELGNGSRVIKKWSEGAIPMFIGNEFIVHIMAMIFGVMPTASGPDGNGKYTRNYTVLNSNLHNTYTVTVYDP